MSSCVHPITRVHAALVSALKTTMMQGGPVPVPVQMPVLTPTMAQMFGLRRKQPPSEIILLQKWDR